MGVEGVEVYVKDGSLSNPVCSYHEEPGCYGAEKAVPWTEAVDAGADPCGRCCHSFELAVA